MCWDNETNCLKFRHWTLGPSILKQFFLKAPIISQHAGICCVKFAQSSSAYNRSGRRIDRPTGQLIYGRNQVGASRRWMCRRRAPPIENNRRQRAEVLHISQVTNRGEAKQNKYERKTQGPWRAGTPRVASVYITWTASPPPNPFTARAFTHYCFGKPRPRQRDRFNPINTHSGASFRCLPQHVLRRKSFRGEYTEFSFKN